MNLLPYYLVGGTESLFDKVDVTDIQAAFCRKIQSYLPNNPVIWVSLTDVRNGLEEQVENARMYLGPDVFVVTLSQLYYCESDGEASCTRMVNSKYESLGLSARPRCDTLEQQVRDLMQQIGKKKVITVDDTLFHGATVNQLQALGLRVDAAVKYFASVDGTDNLQQQGIRVYSSRHLTGYLDVMPLHDFLPGMPLCGKLVQQDNGQDVSSYPYIFPYIPSQLVSTWASIPWEFVHDFSAFALHQTTILAERLAQNGIVTLNDIQNAQPHHVCIPHLNNRADHMDLSLHEILWRAVHYCMV